MVHNYL
jgi:hypothetical protein